MSCVTLPCTLQLLLQSREAFVEFLEHCRIVNVHFSISMLDDPCFDVAPVSKMNKKIIIKVMIWQGPFETKWALSTLHLCDEKCLKVYPSRVWGINRGKKKTMWRSHRVFFAEVDPPHAGRIYTLNYSKTKT